MFNYTICEPLNPKVVDKGSISKEDFRTVLREFPWVKMLQEIENTEESKVHYSPSLELIDPQSNHAISISIVGPETEPEFYIFYQRPKIVNKWKWFKKVEVLDPKYTTDRTGQSETDMEEAFEALLTGNFDLLESRWG